MINMKNMDIEDLFLEELVISKPETRDEMDKITIKLRRKFKMQPSHDELGKRYVEKCKCREYEFSTDFYNLLISRSSKSHSGVDVITVFSSPYPCGSSFTCGFNCYYCPNEEGQPRSYLMKEPGVRKANSEEFDTVRQFYNRATAFINTGHPLDKIEILVLGGTWDCYPKKYRFEFMRDIYYSANSFYTKRIERKTLCEEMIENDTNPNVPKIIGITIETRPDMISKNSLREYRSYGVTRVQIGIQHTNDRVLYRVNRRCTLEQIKKAIRMLKDCCFKVDGHLMPDLPQPLKDGVDNQKEEFEMDDIDFSVDMIEEDRKMFNEMLYNPELQIDQIKIYPCEVVPWTRIKRDYDRGLYRPYATNTKKDNPLMNLIVDFKSKVHPWIRLNRIIRDIPTCYIEGGNNQVSMRDEIHHIMKNWRLTCKCIRCREIKRKKMDDPKLKIREYESSGGIEYFISYENEDETVLYGFLRLRITINGGDEVFSELKNCSLIRELHVYGNVVPVGLYQIGTPQHMGLGKRMLEEAVRITRTYGLRKIAVISGNGVKGYYRKRGFKDELFFMTIKI